jgi:hypothetical protein
VEIFSKTKIMIKNREISGKQNALRPRRGGERISVLVNYGRNAP